jgi:hypothetical protein
MLLCNGALLPGTFPSYSLSYYLARSTKKAILERCQESAVAQESISALRIRRPAPGVLHGNSLA